MFASCRRKFLIGPRLKTAGPIISPPCVRASVRAARHISKTAPRIFLKFGMKLGLNRGSNFTRPLFLIFTLLRGDCLKGKKIPYLTSFWGFWYFEKKTFRGIFLNFPKMCQKNYLLHRTIFSPVKIICWPFLAVYRPFRGKFDIISGFLRLCETTVPRIFFNFAKMCQKNVPIT